MGVGVLIHIPSQQVIGETQGTAEQQRGSAKTAEREKPCIGNTAHLWPIWRGHYRRHGSWFFFHGIHGR
jgi:hypothetical protein